MRHQGKRPQKATAIVDQQNLLSRNHQENPWEMVLWKWSSISGWCDATIFGHSFRCVKAVPTSSHTNWSLGDYVGSTDLPIDRWPRCFGQKRSEQQTEPRFWHVPLTTNRAEISWILDYLRSFSSCIHLYYMKHHKPFVWFQAHVFVAWLRGDACLVLCQFGQRTARDECVGAQRTALRGGAVNGDRTPKDCMWFYDLMIFCWTTIVLFSNFVSVLWLF